jgi:hypothetical protein
MILRRAWGIVTSSRPTTGCSGRSAALPAAEPERWDRRWRVGPNARITSRFIAGRAVRGPTSEEKKQGVMKRNKGSGLRNCELRKNKGSKNKGSPMKEFVK